MTKTMMNKSQAKALKAAHKRAAQFLLPAHATAMERTKAKAEAIELLMQATEALRLAGCTSLSLRTLALRLEAQA
jgi:hypothetical protein